jgi:hypothetical protein
MLFGLFGGRKKQERELAARAAAALAEMDDFFRDGPWKVLSVDPDLAEAMGAFAEGAVGPQDFFTPREEELLGIFGTSRRVR